MHRCVVAQGSCVSNTGFSGHPPEAPVRSAARWAFILVAAFRVELANADPHPVHQVPAQPAVDDDHGRTGQQEGDVAQATGTP